jgi:hypothetical protein
MIIYKQILENPDHNFYPHYFLCLDYQEFYNIVLKIELYDPYFCEALFNFFFQLVKDTDLKVQVYKGLIKNSNVDVVQKIYNELAIKKKNIDKVYYDR